MDNLNGHIQVEDYPVSFDNDYYFTVYVTEAIQVVEVTGKAIKPNTPFQRLFSGEAFRYTSFSQDEIKQDAIDRAQVLILNEVDILSSGLAALGERKAPFRWQCIGDCPAQHERSAPQRLCECLCCRVLRNRYHLYGRQYCE